MKAGLFELWHVVVTYSCASMVFASVKSLIKLEFNLLCRTDPR